MLLPDHDAPVINATFLMGQHKFLHMMLDFRIWSASSRNTSKSNAVKINEKRNKRKQNEFFCANINFLLTGCDNNQEANTSSVVENTALVQTDISMPISQPIVEHIWQKEGPDFSERNSTNW